MPIEPFYSAGAISVANGATTFTLATGALEVNVKVGDELHVDGETAVGIVASITGATEGELLFPWSGTTLVAEADYKFARRGPEWFSAVTITTQQSAILTRITAGGNLWRTVGQPDADFGYAGDFAIEIAGLSAIIYEKDPDTGWDAGTTLVGNGVTSGTGVPSGASGQDGDLYIRTATGDLYLKTSGTWGIIAVITGGVGPAGASAAPTWVYATSTSDVDPGAGVVRFNNAIQSVTRIYFSNTLDAGGTFGAAIDTWDDRGDTSNRGSLFVFNPADPSTWAWFQVTGSVEVATGYRKVNVTRIASNPTTGAIAAGGTDLSFLFIPAGVTGGPGAAGFTPGKRFTFETAISGDPGDGRIRADNAAFASITTLAIDDLDALGVNVETWIQSLDDVENADGRGRLILQAVETGAYMEFNVTGAAADHTGYWTLAVTPIAGEVLADNLAIVAWFYPAGNDGGQGVEGPASVPLGIVYAYDDATADADPGDGEIRFNNADWSLASAMYLDNESYAGVDVSAWIASFETNGALTNRGTVFVQDAEDPARFLIAKVTGSVVDGTGYRKLTIEVIAAGATPSGDSPAAQVGVQFIPSSTVAVPNRLGTSGELIFDWDTAVDSGFYVGIDAVNAPESGSFIGQVERLTDGSYVLQTVRSATATSADTLAWQRARIASSWGSWYRVRSAEDELDERYLGPQGAFITTAMFDAVGDGVADDTAALNAFFGAMGELTTGFGIILPGSYKTTDTLTWQSPNDLRRRLVMGYGATIYPVNTVVETAIEMIGNNLELRGLGLTQSGGGTSVAAKGIVMTAPWQSAVRECYLLFGYTGGTPWDYDAITLRHLDAATFGIGSEITNCEIRSTPNHFRSAIRVEGVQNGLRILRSTLVRGETGIFITHPPEASDPGDDWYGYVCNGIEIASCIFDLQTKAIEVVGISGEPKSRFGTASIHVNRIEHCDTFLDVTGIDQQPTDRDPPFIYANSFVAVTNEYVNPNNINVRGFPASMGLGNVLDVLQREKLTASRTYYVRTDGSNSNTGLTNTSGGAFLTLQKAMDVIAALDLGVYNVTVTVGAGTYTAGLTLKSYVGAGIVTFIGDETTPGNVHIDVASGNAITSGDATGVFNIYGFKVDSANSQDVRVGSRCKVTLRNLEYAGTTNYRVFVRTYGYCIMTGANNLISGGGTGFILAEAYGQIEDFGGTYTLTANVTYTAFATAQILGYIINLATYVLGGFTVTGSRYSVARNGVVVTGTGANHFPGSTAGSTATGGQYA